MTNYHKHGGLKQQKFILSPSWRLGDWHQGVGRATLPPKALGKKPSLSLLASGWCWWPCSLACRGITPIFASIRTWPGPYVSAPLCPHFSLLINTLVLLCLGPTLIQDGLILTWLHYIYKEGHVSKFSIDKNFWGTLQPNKVVNLEAATFSISKELCFYGKWHIPI